jgi:cytochrome c oxidase accessory protein FixG
MATAPTLPNRDSVTTIRDDGSRAFLYPADTHGRFTKARRWSAVGLIVFYLSLPWIKINGYPAVFLDVVERHFHLFGLTFAAQDLWLIFFLITGLGFSLFFVTAMLGRIWCGWACPHTVFLDHVYRRIERWIEGDAVKRRALAAAPMSAGKFFKLFLKHTLYVLVSAVITHLFLAYFASLPAVWAMMRAAPAEHGSTFAFVAVCTAALYFNFAWFREQLCIVICPYGRIQSALIDDHSLVIGYDVKRGEPRGKLSTPDAGDCVACNRCVQVCPTGIDIRQGLQMECVGCTACIDACDDVMTRLRRPTGLIRYDSQTAFAGKRTRWLRPRTALYGALLLAGASVALWAVSTIHPANLGVTRITGAPYIVSEDFVRNQFLVRVVNKRNEPARFLVSVGHGPTGLRQSGLTAALEIPALCETVQPLVLQLPRSRYTGPFVFEIKVVDEAGNFHLEREMEFLGPEARLLREEEAKKHEH